MEVWWFTPLKVDKTENLGAKNVLSVSRLLLPKKLT